MSLREEAAAIRTGFLRDRKLPDPGVLWKGLAPFLLPLAILALWQSASVWHWINPLFLPSPLQVAEVLWRFFSEGTIWRHLGISVQRVFLGFGYGVAVAVLLGAVTGYSAFWRRLIDPMIHGLRTIPGLAWIPMFILWFGIDETSKVALIAKAAFFPTYLNFMSGIVNADRRLIEVGQVYRMTNAQLVRRILLPTAMPYLFVGLRQSMGVAWLVVVAAEMMGASSGIGYLLLDGEMTGRPQIVVACMIIFALCGKATDMAITGISRRLLSWQDTHERAA
ncbi:ABC transporter permease [Celeribacter indicus]|uniref:Binding-protein-dependent transporter inner membrane component n=1 Tax=Celeribacter indicus TaxID=1208324 RepID=A0A0B5DZP3_9RHOB|nr:ABC transporter permease [Celeribacter indicus]AJE46156.1 binding-protein-dependent transporter inner membrane component [Celeribacter indicus]SDX36656.1 sulfonate transport system permease protein [Celeribacter indicus]